MDTHIITGDCLDMLRTLPDNSVDSIVTDPPYGLSNTSPDKIADTLTAWVTGDDTVVPGGKGFMGKAWDGFVPPPAVWKECLRVLKPGGHMAVFAGARTQDLMGLSIRLAGFEIRDTLGWVYGSGFPKSMDVSKAIDKAVGAEGTYGAPKSAAHAARIYEGGSEDARRWAGWGTALKPAIEPIILARKPLVGTVAANVLAHGVGGLNIDASRVPHNEPEDHTKRVSPKFSGAAYNGGKVGGENHILRSPAPAGRFPANVLLDEHAAAEMDKQSGASTSRKGKPRKSSKPGEGYGMTHTGAEYNDLGGASRFFPVFKYQAKAPKKERPVIEREDGSKIQHPTVKPVALMEWLVTLITPTGGTVLDPFAGSGTTLEAAQNKDFSAIGIEREPDYIQLIEQRLTHHTIF